MSPTCFPNEIFGIIRAAMKKIFSLLLILGALCATAEDSYLYWMVGDTTPYVAGTDYTTIRVKSDQGYLNLYAPDASTATGLTTESRESITSAQADQGAFYAQLASGTTYSSFVVELLNDSGFVAQSSTLSYDAALAEYYIATANSMRLPTAWAATSFAIPEPNSAMLLLLGCAALGLRRRRQVKA